MNSYMNTNETEIDLLDLGRYLLRRCVWIVLIGIFFAGVAGGYKYYSMKSAATDVKEVIVQETEHARALQEYEQESELFTISDESTVNLIEDQKEYLQNSLLMQLDPYHVWREQAIVRIVSPNKNISAGYIADLYKQDLAGGGYLKDLAKEMGTDISYLTELLDFDVRNDYRGPGGTVSDVVLHLEDEENIDDIGSISFYVYGDTEEAASNLMNALLDEIKDIQDRVEKDYPHDVSVTAGECTEVVDTSIRDIQKEHMSYTSSLTYQMRDNRDKSKALSDIAESEKAEHETAENEAVAMSGGVSKKEVLKFGLLGFVVGAFLICLWFAFRYITNDKLVDYKDIERKGINLKELGTVSEQGIPMAAANIRNFAGERKKLFLTGMSNEEQFIKVCEGIKEYLSDFEIVYGRDALHDPDTREKLVNCDAAILVEQKNVSCYSEMKEEITFIVNAGKEIVGIVIV